MRRRAFLAGAVVGTAVSLVPRWLSRAFADASITGDGPRGRGEALKPRARPLLVIIAPEGEARWQREAQVGGWLLANDDDLHLAPLALAEVECAPARALPATVDAEHAERLLFARIDPDGKTTFAYTAGAKEDQTAHFTRELERLIPVAQFPMAERRRLASRAEKLRYDPIRGSTWAYMQGCGHSRPHDAVPTDQADVIGCGMGSMGGEARRFLRFYTARDQ
jgi:hypothetical protein